MSELFKRRMAIAGTLVVIGLLYGWSLHAQLEHAETIRVLKPQSERLTTYCMSLRFETEMVMTDADHGPHSAELVLLEWSAIGTADWRSLRPCLLDGTPVEPACYPGELSCARQQAWFAHAHFEYGFLP